MQRTDGFATRMKILIGFLTVCVFFAIFGRQSKENQEVLERFDPEVTEQEIRYYLENDINYTDSDQFGIQTIHDWLPIQSELAQLNLALEYFSRLNLEKILNMHNKQEEEVNKCLDLNLNQELEKISQEINTSQKNQTSNQDSLSNYNNLFQEKIQLSEEIFQQKIEYDQLSAEEKYQKQICAQYQLSELETIKLNNKQFLVQKINDEIKETEQNIVELEIQYQLYIQEQGDQEDLTKEYQKDQELAKSMSRLFKPAGIKSVEIHDEKLGGIVNVLDQNIKQYKTTEVFLNGLNFHPEISKFYIEEIQQTIQRKKSNLEYKRKDKNKLDNEIKEIEIQRKEKNQNYQNAINKLEEIRKKKSELNNKIQEQKKLLSEIIYKLKNYNPQTNLQITYSLDAQKKFKQYLYENMKEDQLCLEKCIEYNSLKSKIDSGRYEISLNSIKKHFIQLENKFKDFKI